MLLFIRLGQRKRKKLCLIFTYIALTGVVVLLAAPFVFMLSSSFKKLGEMMVVPPTIIPLRPTLENYSIVFNETSFVSSLFNSFRVAGMTVLFSMIIATLSAYSLSRFRFKGSSELCVAIVAAQMIPGICRIIPLFVMLNKFHLTNNLWGVIISYTTFSLPFCTWMLKGYFDSIPVELEQSAMIDGCTELGALRKVLLPICAPAIAAVALFAFIVAWNELMLARALLSSEEKYTLAVHLSTFSMDEAPYWGMLMAMSVLITIPSLILFSYLQKYMVAGLTGGAIKG